MRDLDLSNVEEASEYKRLTPGGYICKITSVSDVPINEKTGKGDYLKIEYDITQGDFKGHFQALYDSKQFWGGSFIKSYKESALSFFKAFITSVEKSNAKFVFNNDESSLVGKAIGLVLGEEAYTGNDGSDKRRMYVKDVRSVDAIKKGDFETQALKEAAGYKAAQTNTASDSDGFMNIPDEIDEELPFN